MYWNKNWWLPENETTYYTWWWWRTDWWNALWWDDFWLSSKKKKTSYNYFSDYSSFDWSSFWDSFEQKQKINDFKEDIKKSFSEKYVACNPYVWYWPTQISKKNKVFLNINKDNFKHYNTKNIKNKIINWYDKIPLSWWLIWNLIYSAYINGKKYIWDTASYFWNSFEIFDNEVWWWDYNKTIDIINDFFDWKIDYTELMKNISEDNLKRIEEEMQQAGINPDWTMKSNQNIWSKTTLSNYSLSNKFQKLIKSKINISDIVKKESSLRKWKRLNRLFLEKRDYKPLINKQVTQKVKKKIFFIVDCSWSMWSLNYESSAAYPVVSFLDALIKTNLFDITKIIYHSDSGYWDVKNDFLIEPHFRTWCWEWFEDISTNLDPLDLVWVDYIVTLTDLCIWSQAQDWLYNYLKQWKKHLVLSFERSWDINWMNVKTIDKDKPEQIIDSLLTILW